MTEAIFKEIKDDLLQGCTNISHPFHLCTLATVGLETMPRLRTLVLREVDKDLHLFFYTDSRSKKVLHIKENSKVALLFYHPAKVTQLKVEGLATVLKEGAAVAKHRKTLDSKQKKEYATTEAPGSSILKPENVEFLKDADYFCIMKIEPFRLEYLKLANPRHIKLRFSKENNRWQSEYLVP